MSRSSGETGFASKTVKIVNNLVRKCPVYSRFNEGLTHTERNTKSVLFRRQFDPSKLFVFVNHFGTHYCTL